MINTLHQVINAVCLVLSIIGAIVTIWGIMVAFTEFLIKELLKRSKTVELNEAIRIKLGSYLILALEFFIASDIVRTIITPTWEGLGILGAIVVIRTVLSYFLTKDLEKAKK
jgi:uncharacterized membrane protein